jgi:nicotinamide-nucleotide amidase
MKNQNINAEIITIGDEILIGQVIDTNSAWVAQQLNLIGINIFQITSVSDNKSHILNSLTLAASRVNLILVTGGLGPTKDDITKQTIAEYFNSKLVRNEKVLAHIYKLLEPRGIKINELNTAQADLPDNCKVLHNALGTAAGMWFNKDGRIYVFMPGVPFEMKNIVSNELLPQLKEYFKTPAIVHKTLMLQGIAESMLAQQIEPWEAQLPANIKLAYLPSPGIIRLRLTAKGDHKDVLTGLIDQEVEKLLPIIKNWHYASDDEPLEVTIGKLLKDNKLTVSTAESCTGGKIASMITSVPGSSDYYKGTIVAYDNKIKISALHVPSKIIEENGAVSQPVVEAMAQNVCRLFETDFAVATSGIAGPDGGTPEKPVGTIWISVASKEKVFSRLLNIGDNNRERNIQRTAVTTLGELRKFILESIKMKK